MRELEGKKLSTYLVNIISEYLKDRCIQTSEGYKHEVKSGVLQDSVLGPLL